MIPATTKRVEQNTDDRINETIRLETERTIARSAWGGRAGIERRLREIDREWDIERTLETNAATAVLIGLGLGALMHRRWFALPVVVAGFLLQHALQGWCPPVPIFRRLGFRTSTEIDQERYSLKALRGDFQGIGEGTEPPEFRQIREAYTAARR
jgi:hypothetical protein